MRKRCLLSILIVTLSLTSVGKTWAAESAGQGPAQVSISGRVLDRLGKPVAGAKVTLYQMEASRSSSKMNRAGETVTDSQGAFRFTAAGDPEGRRLAYIIARKEGLALGWTMWREQESQQRDVVLREAKELTGSVVDENGQPVANAEVRVAMAVVGKERDRVHLSGWVLAPQVLTVKTDNAGRFIFSDTPAEATFELLASKPGRATVCTYDPMTYRGDRYHFSPGQAGIKLTLPLEARIEGRVVEKTGDKPIGDVQVVAQCLGVEPVTAGQDGSFSIGALPPGNCTIVPMPRSEGTPEWVAEPVMVNLKAGETTRGVKLLLNKGTLMEIVVNDAATGKPVEGAWMDVRGTRGGSVLGTTDGTGVARARLPAGTYGFIVGKPGYISQWHEEAFTVEEGETKRLDCTLDGEPSINGVVYDDAGHPLEGVELQVVPSGGGTTSSDAQGEFKVTWNPSSWPSGTTYYLVARHTQRNVAVAQQVGEAAGQMEVRLHPGVTLTGQVADSNGKAVTGADVQISFCMSSFMSASFLPHPGVKTDAQGRYEVGAIPPGQRYRISASADDHGEAEIEIGKNEAVGGRTQVSTLTLPIANMSVSGVVVDSVGKPVAGALVRSDNDPQTRHLRREARTDAGGRFTLNGICAGRILIGAEGRVARTFLSGSLSTDAPTTNARIVVEDRQAKRSERTPSVPLSLSGVVYDDVGKPLEGVELRVLLLGFGDEATSDAQGRFKVTSWSNWATGRTYYLIARHTQRNLAVAQPVGEAGSQMEVRLRPGTTLIVQVMDPNGKAIAGADVLVIGSTWGSNFLSYRDVVKTTDAQGRYEVGAIPAGQGYKISASADDHGEAEVEIGKAEAVGGRTHVSTLTLPIANMSVSGVVVDWAGKPVGGALVHSRSDGRTAHLRRETRTDAKGRFTLKGICAGRIYISAEGVVAGAFRSGWLETEGDTTNARIILNRR